MLIIRHSRPVPSGFTLLELLLVFVLLGVLLLIAAGEGARGYDALAVHLSREQAISLVADARMAARTHGGATLVLDEEGPIALHSPSGETLRQWDPRDRGVDVFPRARRTPLELHFGPTGLGRATSLTLEFRRGRSERLLVLSSYGRVRRDG